MKVALHTSALVAERIQPTVLAHCFERPTSQVVHNHLLELLEGSWLQIVTLSLSSLPSANYFPSGFQVS